MANSSDSNTETLDATEEMKERLAKASTTSMDLESLHGTYYIGHDEFAFHIKEMQEVVRYPEKVNRLPLMPDYVVGVFNLRNRVVPLIDLRAILGMDPVETEAIASYVGIVTVSGQLIGVVLDKTGDVLPLKENDIASVAKRNGSSIVSGLASLNAGERIIRVIAASSIVELEEMPVLAQKMRDEREELEHAASSGYGGGETAISFLSDGTEFAIPVENILEVLADPKMEQTHISYDNCLGILNLRGVMISVIDFRSAMGSASTTDIETGMVIVVISDGQYCGFLVDAVTDVFDYNKKRVIPIPVLKDNTRKGCLEGVISVDSDRDVFLLDSNTLCKEEDIQESINANTVPDALEGSEGEGESESESEAEAGFATLRKSSDGVKDDLTVYITFGLGKTLAVEIQEVNEIIAYPKDLMEPPGYEGYIRGMLNLRGSIIPVVDMRKYYGMDDYEDIDNSSVLIVTCRGALYGLIVDTVEDSIDVYESQTTVMPKLMIENAGNDYKGDITSIIEYTDVDGETNTLMIYSVSTLLDHLVGSMVA